MRLTLEYCYEMSRKIYIYGSKLYIFWKHIIFPTWFHHPGPGLLTTLTNLATLVKKIDAESALITWYVLSQQYIYVEIFLFTFDPYHVSGDRSMTDLLNTWSKDQSKKGIFWRYFEEKIKAGHIQGVPKNVLIEFCWSHGSQALSPVVGTTWAWKVFFLVVSY